jgi:hypothetical protein
MSWNHGDSEVMAQKCSQAPQKEEEEEEEETKKKNEEEEEDALPYYKTGVKSKHFHQLVPPLLVI